MPLNVVVVGGQGFLGAAVVRELLARNDSIVVLDRCASQRVCDGLFGADMVEARPADILSPETLRAAFWKADEVYHLAGRLGTSELDQDIHAAVESNVMGAVNVFQAALEAAVPVVFYPSKPNVWLNAYTITKVAAEQFADLFGERGLRVCTLRYFNAYGPGQAIGPVRKIMPTFALQASRGDPLTVYGDGEQTVDMIYAPDVARITIDLVRSGERAGVMDCGRGIALTVNQVAKDVAAHFGSAAGMQHLPMRIGETPGTKLVANIQPLRGVLGALAFADWKESLATTLSWYAERSS
jgi:UDP-glucose 4-epimerase